MREVVGLVLMWSGLVGLDRARCVVGGRGCGVFMCVYFGRGGGAVGQCPCRRFLDQFASVFGSALNADLAAAPNRPDPDFWVGK